MVRGGAVDASVTQAPLLVGTAVAGPQLDLRAVGRSGAAHVEAQPRLDTGDGAVGGGLLDADGLDGAELDGEVPPNWVKNLQTSGLTQLLAPLSQPAQPSTGPCWWPPSNAAQTTGYPARQPE